jgi:hypothetical protein
MKKLEVLTKKQEDLIPIVRQEWLDLFFKNKGNLNKKLFEAQIDWLYKRLNYKKPFIWYCDSPLMVQIIINIIKNTPQTNALIRENNNIRDNIGANIWANIWANIGANIGDNIRANIGDNIGANIRANIRANIWANIRANIWANIGDNIGDNKLEFFGFSDSEASWLHWYIYQKFFFDQGLLLEDKYSQQLNAYIELCIDAWAVYYSKDIAIVSRKPSLKREDGRLHSDQVPAVSFKDGYELYYLDGVHFEKEMWQKVISQTMSFKDIMAIEVSDQRTVALKYNPNAILNEGSKLVHKDDRNNELYLIEGKDINTELEFPKIWFLKMLCPTGRTFIEGVPPDEAEKNPNATAMQALLCGLRIEDYVDMRMES